MKTKYHQYVSASHIADPEDVSPRKSYFSQANHIRLIIICSEARSLTTKKNAKSEATLSFGLCGFSCVFAEMRFGCECCGTISDARKMDFTRFDYN